MHSAPLRMHTEPYKLVSTAMRQCLVAADDTTPDDGTEAGRKLTVDGIEKLFPHPHPRLTPPPRWLSKDHVIPMSPRKAAPRHRAAR